MCSRDGFRNSFLCLLLLRVVGAAGADIDLSPIPSVRELEGCKFVQVEFRDNGHTITYEPPRGWRYVTRDKYTLALTPPNKEFVSAKIKFIPTPGTLVLDEAQLQRFRDTAASLLPPDSQILTAPVITPNPLRLGDHATCEIDLTFMLHTHRLRTSVLFVDLGDSQLRFSLIAGANDFEELHKLFQDSWYSWQWPGNQ
jgi:hypothetical protein